MRGFYLYIVLSSKGINGSASKISEKSARSISNELNKKTKPLGLAIENSQISLVYYFRSDSVYFVAEKANKILTKFLDPLIAQYGLSEPNFQIKPLDLGP